jgi:exodeoxyribonuclease V alpha subunit
LAKIVGEEVVADDPPTGAAVADGIVLLDRVRRYGGEIAAVAVAVRRGDADAALAALAAGAGGVEWLPSDVDQPGGHEAAEAIRERVVPAVGGVVVAARAGDARGALDALGSLRVLCAHRRGPHGVSWWTERIERWLTEDLDGFEADQRWYVGRPLLVTHNDPSLRLYNGDTGVVVATEDGNVAAAFDRGGAGEVVTVRPGRLEAIESAYAMTIHKSQGSQFGTAAVVLPPPTSPVLTRELLYTAVTRAERQLVLAGTEEAIRAAIARPAARASGLRERLWGS